MTRLWFAKAEDDLRVSKTLLGATVELLGPILFHCQQAVEKSIKGCLTFKKIRFQKTHDIGKLLDLVSAVAPDLASKYKEAAEAH